MADGDTIISTVQDGDRWYLPIPETAAEKDALAERLERVKYADTLPILLAVLLRQTAKMQRRLDEVAREAARDAANGGYPR